MGKKSPDPPDLQPVAQGSIETARIAQQTAREQLDFAREQNTQNQEILRRVIGSQEQIQNETLENARTDRQRFEELYQPLEENLIDEFQNYDSPERLERETGRAVADVNTQFDAARRNALQRLESFGVDPSQTRSQALDLETRIAQASATAGAATNAQRNVEDKGRALRAEALNIGRGYPSNVAGSYGQSLNAGNSQINNATAVSGTGAGLFGSANGALNTSIGGFNGGAGIQTQGFQNRLAGQQEDNSALISGIGAAAGIAALFLADGGKIPKRTQAIPSYDSDPGEIDFGQGDGSGIDDRVPIMASTGEFIIPKDVVDAKGDSFERLIEKYHTPAEQQREATDVQEKANGGLVRMWKPRQSPRQAIAA